ncbi:glycoside hydrolase family 47 protein [Dendrothele bispora CBS 962.96]|uniref:alpha-1,2-Mannosidase n=1 Tax=Dendrothele bispora (strain CBS 962.96) TaxID=1314807 RepID=A0A4S8LC18_DENBC|nr:glycoside hydrolase family 47 protein [Dendrothele bispora CBS 962.96]
MPSRPPTSLPQVIQALFGRPQRWIPFLLGFGVFLWFIGPFLFLDGPPPHPRDAFGLPPPPGHPHRPPLRMGGPDNPDALWAKRAVKVKDAFIHAYTGYRRHAFTSDELLPLSGKKVDNFNGWGVSIYDALDTMLIMGLREYYDEALGVVKAMDFSKMAPNAYAPFFETVIRYLGGLLSAYALSGDKILLERADDLGRVLLPAFNSSSGFPMYAVNTETGKTKGGWTGKTLWAEALSCQMEYKYLAHLTGKHEYYDKVEHIMTWMYDANITDGVFPTQWDAVTGQPGNNRFSVGAFADSAHEYLLKQWLLTGRSENKIKDLYLKAANSIIDHLLYITPDRELLYVTDSEIYRPPRDDDDTTATATTTETENPNGIRHNPSHTFEHLSCFLPGLLALGTHTLDLSPADKERHEWAAIGLGYTCWLTYADQATGLGPDEVTMKHWLKDEEGLWVNQLEEWEKKGRPTGRPPGLREGPSENEMLIESLYILWRTTGDDTWRKRGWMIFQSIERHAKTEHGYASLLHVDTRLPDSPALKDEMPSYFLAETLKYLYLLFTDEEIIPLSKYVFNTEAHPLPIFEWNKEEKEAYNIPFAL